MHKLKKMLMDQLIDHEEELTKMGGKVTTAELDKIHKLTDTIKNLDKIEMLESEGGYSEQNSMRYSRNGYSQEGYSRDGYSRDGEWEARGDYSRGNSYEGESSYARRGRDSRGRYTHDDGKDRMIEKLREMMNEIPDEKDRESIKRCIKTLENA